jgi:outer membrane murein-binding lipoprotein Lpp
VLRRDRVERELMKAKERLAEARKLVPIREKELADYEKWVDEEIDRKYNALLKKPVRKGRVDDLASDIRLLRGKIPEYVKRVQDARDDVQKAEEELELKKEEMAQAHRDLEKLYAHREEWMAEQRKLEEFNSDKELEEAVRQKNQSEENEMEIADGTE